MKHSATIQFEFLKYALTTKERQKIPLNVDIELELRIGDNSKPSWKIDTNIDEQEYSYMRDEGEDPTKQDYLEWSAQLQQVAKWLKSKSKLKDTKTKHFSKIQTEFSRYAKLLNDISKAEKSSKKSVFLGGKIDKDDKWRKEIKKLFGNKFNFLDPFDVNWEAKDNIYDECSGLLKADIIIFYDGGEQTKKEKEFLDSFDKSYQDFSDISKLKDYLKCQ